MRQRSFAARFFGYAVKMDAKNPHRENRRILEYDGQSCQRRNLSRFADDGHAYPR